MPSNTLFQIKGIVERDIREAYTGGAVDVYFPHNHEWVNKDITVSGFTSKTVTKEYSKLYFYDKVSLYPSIMATYEMPVGKPIAFEGDIRTVNPNAQGYFYCGITSPKIQNPILQKRTRTANGVRTIAGLVNGMDGLHLLKWIML